MSVASANVRSLNESRAQALQALQSVAERLGDILGDTSLAGEGTVQTDTSSLVNEEGLPIIDITEPVDELDTPSLTAATDEYEVAEEDNYPGFISEMSPEALAISRKHRDKILDLLEQEEEREELKTRQDRQLDMKRKREAARMEMEKRMLSQGLDLEKRRQAKELEKKMAKALISGLGESETSTSTAPTKLPDGKTKKVVTFADPPSTGSDTFPNAKQQTGINWGDVAPATFPSRRSHVSISKTQPMKMEVIERTFSQSSTSMTTPQPLEKLKDTETAKDSDDESDLELSSESTVLEPEDENAVLSAQRHRELALEYYQRREALVSSAGALKLEDDELQSDDATNWDKEEVPLDATLAHPHPKPRVSKFRASLLDRKDTHTPTPVTQVMEHSSLARSSGGSSRSGTFGTSVLPTDALSRSIKLGKVVDDQLVAGPQDDDREEREEEEIRKLLLRSMEEYSKIAAPFASTLTSNRIEADFTPHSSLQPVSSTKRSSFNTTSLHHSHMETATPPITSSTNVIDSPSLASSLSSHHLTGYAREHLPPAIPPTSHSMVISSSSFMPSPSSSIIDSSPFPRSVDSSLSPSSARGRPTIIPTPNTPSGRQAVIVDNVREKSADRASSMSSTSDVTPRRISRFKACRIGLGD